MNAQTDMPRLKGDQLLELMTAGERRNRQRRRDDTGELAPYPPCPVCRQPVDDQTVTLGTADEDERVLTNKPCGHRMTYNLKVAQQFVGRAKAAVDEEERAAGAGGLDKARRYLRPVRATIISDDPDGVHLAVYSWLDMFGEWATGPGICGESMQQGALPEGTAVTCAACLRRQPQYERMLAPGYRPEDDDPEALRQRAETAERQRDTAADALAAEWHRRNQRLEELAAGKGPEAQVAIVEHVRGELIGLRGALGILLGGEVQGGTADLLGWAYYQEWRHRQETQS